MNGFDDEEAAIIAFFQAGWAERTPVDYPNGPAFDPAAAPAFARLTVLTGRGRRASVGAGTSRLRRWPGVVEVQLFVKWGTGSALMSQLCDAAATIFDEQSPPIASGKLSFGTPSRINAGRTGSWWQQNVSCPYERDSFG